MKQLLLKRKYHVNGTWYAPIKYLESFKSVIRADHLEMSSSAGDWSGYILQKVFGKFYLILFWQENKGNGFDIFTDGSFVMKMDRIEPTKEECDEIMWKFANLF